MSSTQVCDPMKPAPPVRRTDFATDNHSGRNFVFDHRILPAAAGKLASA
jgi:hypothetical protein